MMFRVGSCPTSLGLDQQPYSVATGSLIINLHEAIQLILLASRSHQTASSGWRMLDNITGARLLARLLRTP